MTGSRIAATVSLSLLLAACATKVPTPAPAAPAAAPTPLHFSVAAEPNDAWNAVGQILVRTPGVDYDGRSQMMGLYAIRYRGQPLMLIKHGVPISGTVTVPTTDVGVAARDGKAATDAGAAELLALLARELPAEIERVRARFAAEKAAKAKAKKTTKKKRK